MNNCYRCPGTDSRLAALDSHAATHAQRQNKIRVFVEGLAPRGAVQRSLDILLILRQLLRDSLILINRGLFGLVAESIIEAVAADSQKPILFGDCAIVI
jgi:hypothetical protein